MMHTHAHTLGKEAERRATAYLSAKGCTIHERNYRFGRGEVDIIAQQREILLFIEVKVRSSLRFGFPETFVTPTQKRWYQTVATHYVEEKKWHGAIRFDILAIVRKAKHWDITHLQDAFY